MRNDRSFELSRLFAARDELGFLLQLSMTDLQALAVAIRGRLEKWGIGQDNLVTGLRTACLVS